MRSCIYFKVVINKKSFLITCELGKESRSAGDLQVLGLSECERTELLSSGKTVEQVCDGEDEKFIFTEVTFEMFIRYLGRVAMYSVGYRFWSFEERFRLEMYIGSHVTNIFKAMRREDYPDLTLRIWGERVESST